MSTTALRYTTATPSAASIMGRIHAAALAAPRKAAERAAAEKARQEREDAALAEAVWLHQTLTAEGAARVGFKICYADGGKWRVAYDIDDPACFRLLVSTYGEDAEVWGIRADGTYCETVS